MRPVASPVVLLLGGALSFAAGAACKGRFRLPPDARYVTQIALGDGFGCARMKDGSVRAWGANRANELGDGTVDARPESVGVVGVPALAKVAAGGQHACGVGAEGEVYCWGANGFGELGDGSRQPRTSPVRVAGVTAKELALGAHHSCALGGDGDVVCWGARDGGSLGGGEAGSPLVRVRQATAIAAGGDATCAILRDRTLSCWGSVPGLGLIPVTRIAGIADVTSVAVSDTHVCAARAWGGVACWGKDEEGELGDGAFTDRAGPVDVVGLTVPARAVAVGRAHSCALLGDGTIRCWGANASSQLADGTTAHHASPLLVNGMFDVQEVVAAGDAACARFADGSERCWGGLWLPKTAGATIPVPTEVRW